MKKILSQQVNIKIERDISWFSEDYQKVRKKETIVVFYGLKAIWSFI